MALTLVVAGVCATRWRWAPHLAVLWCLLSIIPGLEHYRYDLAHPAEISTFITTVLILGLSLVAVVASIAAIIYSDRQVTEGRTPRWLMSFLIGMAAFVLGAILVAAIPAPDATAGVSAEALAQLPALVSGQNTFSQTELRARVGETMALRLRRVRRSRRDAGRHADSGTLHADRARQLHLLLPHPRSPGSRHAGHTDRRVVRKRGSHRSTTTGANEL